MSDLIHDPFKHRLGKHAAKPSRLKIRDYIDLEKALPQAPVSVNNSNGQSYQLQMYDNDKYGDCTCAAVGNTLIVNSKGATTLPDSAILAAYTTVTGIENGAFNAGPPAVNDNGAAEIDVLDMWVKSGVGGDKLIGHAGVDMTNLDEVRAVLWLFGSVYIGLQLAVEQQGQTVWDYVSTSQPGSWGGHAVPLFDANVSYDEPGAWVLGTWGAFKACTGAFLINQADEGHAPITPAWIAANANNPLVNVAALTADLGQLTAEA